MFRKRSNFDTRLWSGNKLSNRLSRLKYFRGHGVHSPYVYSIYREVFMSKELYDGGLPIFEELRKVGINDRTSLEIANLVQYCKIKDFAINKECDGIIICTTECTDKEVLELFQAAKRSGTAIVILSPYMRQALCNTLIGLSNSATIDRFYYLILLNNHLSKQHFRL